MRRQRLQVGHGFVDILGAEVRFSYKTDDLRGAKLPIRWTLLSVEKDGTLGAVDRTQDRALARLDRKLADARNVPAFVVFSDATLLEMATYRPQSESAMLAISGVGPKKLAQYGELFLALLRSG